jgi:hypothetical protein
MWDVKLGLVQSKCKVCQTMLLAFLFADAYIYSISSNFIDKEK